MGDNFTAVETDLVQLNNTVDMFFEVVDRIIANKDYSISKKDGNAAKQRMKSALNILHKRNDHGNKLCEKDMIQIYNMVDEVRSKSNSKMLLQQIDGGIGIEEAFRGKQFYFE